MNAHQRRKAHRTIKHMVGKDAWWTPENTTGSTLVTIVRVFKHNFNVVIVHQGTKRISKHHARIADLEIIS